MRITEEYCKAQTEFHQLRPDYGTSGAKHVAEILQLAQAIEAETVLDYGCGKATLAKAWPERDAPMLINYDPCIPEYEKVPPACDLVFCGDVLEHIELECLEAVVMHLALLTKKAALLVINTGPAAKTLQDGRNAHLIQEGPRWWLEALGDLWHIDNLFYDGRDLMIAGRPA